MAEDGPGLAVEIVGEDKEAQEHLRAEVRTVEWALGSAYTAFVELGSWAPYLDWSARLEGEGVLTTQSIIQAFREVRRQDFIPGMQQRLGAMNRPAGIGHEQTNSQPSLVATMLEALRPQAGQKILDLGAGSGWTTALLASVVGEEGRVLGLEIIPELVTQAQANLAKYGFTNAIVMQADSELGAPSLAPFDRILVSAQVLEEWLPLLTAQLADGGTMVVPLTPAENYGKKDGYKDRLVAVKKQGNEIIVDTIEPQVGFVPLIYHPPKVNGQATSLADGIARSDVAITESADHLAVDEAAEVG